MFQVWEQLPKGVILQVLKQLAPNDLMQARQVCSHWSSIARQQTLEVVLTIHPDSNTITLQGFLIVELRPQDDHMKQWLFLRLAAMPLDMFANFLQKLTSQVCHRVSGRDYTAQHVMCHVFFCNAESASQRLRH